MRETLIPEYYKHFSCTGNACEYNCCNTWRVTIDKKTYKKYMNIPDGTLKKKLQKNVKRIIDPRYYALIQMEPETNDCPFQTEQGLCEIQLNFGEEYLSRTCAVYPRVASIVNGEMEACLMMSCPEAAKHALLQKEPMAFERILLPEIPAMSNIHFSDELANANFSQTRLFIIQILQNRLFSFENRLVLLGLFLQKRVQTAPANVHSLIMAYQQMFEDPHIAEEIASLPTVKETQFSVVNLLFKLVHEKIKDPHYALFARDILLGLELKKDLTVEERGENYLRIVKEFDSIAPQWDYIFEHYFVNDYFHTSHNYSKFQTLWDKYMETCVTYLMIKFHLAGLNNFQNGLSENDMVRVFYMFTRSFFAHNQEQVKRILQQLKEDGCSSLAHMTTLIRT